MDEVRVLLHWNHDASPFSMAALQLILVHFRKKFGRSTTAYKEELHIKKFENGWGTGPRDLVAGVLIALECSPAQKPLVERLIDTFAGALRASASFDSRAETDDDMR